MCPAPWNNEPLPTQHLHTSSSPDSDNNKVANDYDNKMGVRTDEVQPPRPYPSVHPPVDAPICVECRALENTFFDPNCKGCRKELTAADANPAHFFAVMRQWVPQVQQSIEWLIEECLRRGAHPDDRDSLTDMTLLMYACKGGAKGVGDATGAASVAKKLIDAEADLETRCKWTQMSALHYAAYFDVEPVLKHILLKTKGSDVDSTCSEYENGTALHIAAANLSANAVKILLQFGADVNAKDELARLPVDCIPMDRDDGDLVSVPDAEQLAEKIKVLLTKGLERVIGDEDKEYDDLDRHVRRPEKGTVSGRTALKATGLKIGDRVLVAGGKLGTLRFFGTADFAPGTWAGVALDAAEGKNDGSVNGVVYFKCKPEHGVFVSAKKISKVGKNFKETKEIQPANRPVNHGKVKVAHVASRLTDCLDVIEAEKGIKVGDRVRVSDVNAVVGKPTLCDGTLRYKGPLHFEQNAQNPEEATEWFGVELDLAIGRNDGSIRGQRYFTAPANTGVFVTEAKVTKLMPHQLEESQKMIEQHLLNEETKMAVAAVGRPFSKLEKRISLSTIHNLSKEQNNNNLMTTSVTSSNGGTAHILPSLGGSSTSPGSNNLSKSNGYFPTSKSKPDLLSPTAERIREEGWKAGPAEHYNKFKGKKIAKKYLEPGNSVICIHNKEMGVVKYVGRVDFAPGIWVGLELRNPAGKHDGVVEGRRYFNAKPRHGVMIKPKLISVHGITGDKLLKEEHEYPY